MAETKHADPTALGLFGLAMVTLVASTQKLGLTHDVYEIIPWAIFLGSIAQLVAGVLDYKKLNIFGATAFFGYGLFWMAIATTWFIQFGMFGEEARMLADYNQLGTAYLGYLIFTIIMTLGSFETNKVLMVIFLLIDVLFVGLTFSAFGISPHTFKFIAGLAELFIAVVSFYGIAANVLNHTFEREFLPIGKPLGIFKK